MPNLEQTPAADQGAGPVRGRRLRQRLADSAGEESVAGLEQVFEAKLAAVRVYEKQLAAVNDPYARKTLERMIRQERRELTALAELAELMESSPQMGSVGRFRRRLGHQIKTATGRDAYFWLGALAVGAVLLPSVRERLRPLAVRTVQGVMDISEQVKGLLSGVQEDIEDLVSEAEFERLKNSIDAAIGAETDEMTPPDGGGITKS